MTNPTNPSSDPVEPSSEVDKILQEVAEEMCFDTCGHDHKGVVAVDEHLGEEKAKINRLLVDARKKGYNSGWSARQKTKPKKVQCPICKSITNQLNEEG